MAQKMNESGCADLVLSGSGRPIATRRRNVMRVPKQAPSVDRSITVRTQQAAEAGAVAPSGWMDILKKGAMGALTGALN
jgi:hypothetical protein